jgi:hypothetical protein
MDVKETDLQNNALRTGSVDYHLSIFTELKTVLDTGLQQFSQQTTFDLIDNALRNASWPLLKGPK